MAYVHQTSLLNDILVARPGGERHEVIAENLKDLWAFWSGVPAEMKREGVRKLLAMLSVEGAFRSLDVPSFYCRLGEMDFTADMRAAVVFDLPEHQQPIMKLAISGAQRDGWNMHICCSEAETLAWPRQAS